jgi:hypothetical protein
LYSEEETDRMWISMLRSGEWAKINRQNPKRMDISVTYMALVSLRRHLAVNLQLCSQSRVLKKGKNEFRDMLATQGRRWVDAEAAKNPR